VTTMHQQLALDRQAWAREVREILADLPAQQADMVRLVYFQGSSSSDAAQTLNITKGEARQALATGILGLGRALI
jgi:DNA-directed RNA polymerase specialized sigma24 family protein